jgi:hypothetical protein
MREEIKSAIQREERAIAALREKVPPLMQRFLPSATRFLQEWYETTTEHFLAEYPDKTRGLSQERLKEMKGKVRTLISSAEKETASLLGDNRLFFPFTKTPLPSPSDQCPLKQALRERLALLGPVLEEFGYLNFPGDRAYWAGCDSLSRDHTPLCPYMVEFPEEITSFIAEYSRLCGQAKEHFLLIQRLEDEKKRASILQQWNSI